MTVRLYRAISKNELEDIKNYGGFRAEPEGRSYESKLFATSDVDAARFGRDNFQLDCQPFHLIVVEVSEGLANMFERLILDQKSAVNVPAELLPQLNKVAQIEEILTIPLG